MKKIKLFYRMLKSSDPECDYEDGSTITVVTDEFAQRLLDGENVGKVVCYLIAMAFLQGWNGGCLLIKAEELKPLTLPVLREMAGELVYDNIEKMYRVISRIKDLRTDLTIIDFEDGYSIFTDHDRYELLEQAPL